MPGRDIGSADARAYVEELLNRRPAVGFALGVVRGGSSVFSHVHGVADIASRRPVTEDTVFRVASITKTFTAIAVMQLVERGLLDLDAPLDGYLRSFRVDSPDPAWRPATVRHLLTHTAGIGEEVPRSGVLRRDFGESVVAGRPIPTLAEHYRGALRLDAEPGTRFRYTDHGLATAGQVVEDVSGEPFEHYLREHVFLPLGMTDTDLVRSEVVRSRLATGYRLGTRGAVKVAERDWVTAGASSAFSTPKDMGRYLAALMSGGRNEHGSVLEPSTLASMFTPQYQPDPRLPGIGLAFYRGDLGGHPVVEHQGILPGFDSQIFVAPDDRVAVMAFTNGTRLGMLWLPFELSRLLGHLIDVPEEGVATGVPQRPDVWSDLCGWYRLPGPATDLRARAMVGAGVEVLVRRGRLVLRCLAPVPALYKGVVLHPDDEKDPYVFRIDLSDAGLGTLRVAFSREAGRTTAVHLDVMPLSAYKQPDTTNPRVWARRALAAGAAMTVAREVGRRGRRSARRS
ncbi:MAG TPA: serine hydrolase domain-containing protein [Nocardioidaceae bacterium]|nr:serine hydrolase domain-containing protein [Nocardioidaceae bacterium]